MTESLSPRLREMRWWDIDPVLELEKDLFPEDAWSRGMFWSELAHARGAEATRRYLVAEVTGAQYEGGVRVVGYAGLATTGTASGTASDSDSAATGDIQTIAVARDHWGTGLGATLLTELLSAASEFECAEVMLECRVDNIRAQKLYERFGFAPIGFRRGYYQPGNVDALVMRLTTDPDSSSAAGSTSVQGTEFND
ncbi:GNAT family N-acetyltransferase [Streptomyces sp. W16]|uniref:GNAT family N-acetyltransferase n=1 Tax=Streptomyces sp. W16 TaxID=3076631 RepID=UPI00295BFC7E|nr:GNAT family N-acetyltransferase [Streptomyces sp. W16]MDV9174346.1 GNAT family N-acetyltransferase [Streptomyces sp. W16]